MARPPPIRSARRRARRTRAARGAAPARCGAASGPAARGGAGPCDAADLAKPEDRALAYAIAAETLRRLPDLDALIDRATAKRLPDDAKARFALRIALAQALAMGTPPHAAIATALPLVDGGPRRLVHGVFGTVMRKGWTLPDPPSLPGRGRETLARGVGRARSSAAARRLIAAPPPVDLSFPPDRPPAAGGRQPAARPSPPAGRHPRAGCRRLCRGRLVGAGYRRLAAGPDAGRGRGADRARSLRRAGRQDDAARRRRLAGDGGRRLGKSSRATFRPISPAPGWRRRSSRLTS